MIQLHFFVGGGLGGQEKRVFQWLRARKGYVHFFKAFKNFYSCFSKISHFMKDHISETDRAV